MAVFTITTFSTFAGLLVAGSKLATDPNPVNWIKALADLASNGKALAAALKDNGLTPLAAEMTRVAEETALHFTHPGHARDDAIALFWQVAPEAFSDPAVFAAADLDAATATDRMVAAIKASPHARDFTATGLPESLFRQVAHRSLTVMLAQSEYIATITPDLWRETLRRHGVQIELLTAVKEDTVEILLLVRELHAIRQTTVPEDTLIAMARKISPRVTDRDEALRELDRAADIAANQIARGEAGSNVDVFVDGVLRRLGELTNAGRLDEAAEAADQAVDQAEAGVAQLLSAAIAQHLLAYDAEAAARQIVKRIGLQCDAPADLFTALRREQHVWYERGRDKGLRLDLEVSIALARQCRSWARDADARGAALNILGTALGSLGERESGTARLEEASAAYRAALEEYTRDRGPLDWAMTQNNLGTALQTLGARESGTARLVEAVAAYRAALEEYTRDRVPLDWARTQNNLGNALQTLGMRESGTARLEEAVLAYRAALEEYTRDRVPLDWAATQNNLGAALHTLGGRDSGTARLEEAVAAYRAALEERTRDRVPLDWAATQNNLGNALQTLGERESGTARLEEAVAAYRAALKERTRDRVPLNWAETQNNLGTALQTLGARESGTARLVEAVAASRAALEELTRDRVPLNWATTQDNLGNTLRILGERESGTARLEEAVAAHRAALEERSRDRVPIDWATSIGNQGIALTLLAERTADAAMALRACDQIAAAEAALREGGHEPFANVFSRQLPAAEALVARLAKV